MPIRRAILTGLRGYLRGVVNDGWSVILKGCRGALFFLLLPLIYFFSSYISMLSNIESICLFDIRLFNFL
ncbi:MAG: hypothetical protein QXY49_03030, partial [Thermofilaceae archaeon]